MVGHGLFLSEHQGDARPDTLVGLFVRDIDPIVAEFGRPQEEPPYGCEFELRDPDATDSGLTRGQPDRPRERDRHPSKIFPCGRPMLITARSGAVPRAAGLSPGLGDAPEGGTVAAHAESKGH